MSLDYTFSEYEVEAVKSAVYPGSGQQSQEGINYCLVALAGETGELLNKWKKVLRGDRPLDHNARGAIIHEMGDILWYLTATARELGVDLGDIAKDNITMLRSRRERNVVKGDGDER